MIKTDIKKLCDQAEREMIQLMAEAYSGFNNGVNSLDIIENKYRLDPTIVYKVGPFSKWLNSGIEEIKSIDMLFKTKVQNALSPMINMLSTLCKSGSDVESILYIVEKLEYFAQNSESFKCIVKKRNLSFTACYDSIVSIAKEWREKVTKSPTVQKGILSDRLKENQDKLDKAKLELKKDQSALEEGKRAIDKYFETYSDRVSESLLALKATYQKKLALTEEAQKALSEKAIARCSAFRTFVCASPFRKKSSEKAYRAAEEAYQSEYSNLKRLEGELSDFAEKVFKPEFAKIEKRTDELLKEADALKERIAAKEKAIQGYNGAISKIKKELKGG